MLIYSILDREKDKLKFLGKNLQNVEVIERTITELKKHNVTEERLQETIKATDDIYLKSKLEDMRFSI